MAKKVQVILVDDFDGSDAAESIAFGMDGITYTIDLSTDNAAAFRELMAPYIAAGHREARSGGRRNGAGRATAGPSATDIRAWALANGKEVSARGRVSSALREAYLAANR